MGTKPSNIYAMDRPESGGTDHNSERENSGLLGRAKQEFAESQKAKRSKPDGDPAKKRSNKSKRPPK